MIPHTTSAILPPHNPAPSRLFCVRVRACGLLVWPGESESISDFSKLIQMTARRAATAAAAKL